MKTKKKTGIMPPTRMGIGMGGQPMMRPPMTRLPILPPATRRPPVMKAKGMPLAGFAPGPKKTRKGKKVQKRFAI